MPRIRRVDDKFYIEDMQSRNGTYVNGRLIRERHLLNDHDRITLCDVVLLFNANETSEKAEDIPDPACILESTALLVDDDPGEQIPRS